jgi:hypothetical protein
MTSSRVNGTTEVGVVLDAANLPPDALALLQISEAINVQCGADWFALLAKHVFQPQNCAAWLVARDSAGVCQAVWPVQTGRQAGSMSNYYTALYMPAHAPRAGPDVFEALARTLKSSGLGRGTYMFAPMDPESNEFAAVASGLSAAGLVTSHFFRFGNWYLPCDGMPWERYFAERKGAVRNTVRRMGKKLTADGGTLEIITGGERLQAGIDAYEQVYGASWKQTEPYPAFVRELMLLCSERGWLRLGVAWLNGRAIATQFWIVANGRAEIFKVAYDEAFKAYTAGTLLTAGLMEHVLDKDHVREVDYLIGDDAYKKTWMSLRRERWGLVAYNPWSLGGAIGLARETAGRLKKRWSRPPQEAPKPDASE